MASIILGKSFLDDLEITVTGLHCIESKVSGVRGLLDS